MIFVGTSFQSKHANIYTSYCMRKLGSKPGPKGYANTSSKINLSWKILEGDIVSTMLQAV